MRLYLASICHTPATTTSHLPFAQCPPSACILPRLTVTLGFKLEHFNFHSFEKSRACYSPNYLLATVLCSLGLS
jgi:hypothetical protein